MSAGHLLLAMGMTMHVALALRLETRDLRARFGSAYDVWHG